MAERQANPPPDESEGEMRPLSQAAASQSVFTPTVEVSVTGVDEVMRKAMEQAQEDHKTAVRGRGRMLYGLKCGVKCM